MSTAKKAKKAAPAKRAAKRPAKRAAAPRRPVPRRADYGAPIDGFFTKQKPELRVILEDLRTLVLEAAPEATAVIKWGMPFFSLGGEMYCALAGFKSHVNLILPGDPGTFDDPEGLLEGEAKGGRHLKLRAEEAVPRPAVRRWLKTAARNARAKTNAKKKA